MGKNNKNKHHFSQAEICLVTSAFMKNECCKKGRLSPALLKAKYSIFNGVSRSAIWQLINRTLKLYPTKEKKNDEAEEKASREGLRSTRNKRKRVEEPQELEIQHQQQEEQTTRRKRRRTCLKNAKKVEQEDIPEEEALASTSSCEASPDVPIIAHEASPSEDEKSTVKRDGVHIHPTEEPQHDEAEEESEEEFTCCLQHLIHGKLQEEEKKQRTLSVNQELIFDLQQVQSLTRPLIRSPPSPSYTNDLWCFKDWFNEHPCSYT